MFVSTATTFTRSETNLVCVAEIGSFTFKKSYVRIRPMAFSTMILQLAMFLVDATSLLDIGLSPLLNGGKTR